MPIVRCDILSGHNTETKDALYKDLHDAIADNWAKGHISIALTETHAWPDNKQVVLPVDLRTGRSPEKQHRNAHFDQVEQELERLAGTRDEDHTRLIHYFPVEARPFSGTPLP